jgi:hypothetical protein
MTQLDELTQGLTTEIAELERLYSRLPDVIAKKKAQLTKLHEVARIMTDSSDDEDGIFKNLVGLTATTARPTRRTRGKGPNLPSRVMTLLHAAGLKGLEFKGILGNLEEQSGEPINRSHLLTTLKRLVDRRKIVNVDGRFKVS